MCLTMTFQHELHFSYLSSEASCCHIEANTPSEIATQTYPDLFQATINTAVTSNTKPTDISNPPVSSVIGQNPMNPLLSSSLSPDETLLDRQNISVVLSNLSRHYSSSKHCQPTIVQ